MAWGVEWMLTTRTSSRTAMMLATPNQPPEYHQIIKYPIDFHSQHRVFYQILRGRIVNGKWRVKRSAWRAGGG